LVDRKLKKEEDFLNAGKEILNKGPKCLIITFGGDGSLLTRKEKDGIFYFRCPSIKVDKIVDTTGCGDAFTAGFISGFLYWNNPILATALGSIVSGLNCEAPGMKGFEKAKDARFRIGEFFPGLEKRVKDGYKGEKYA
jgi:sugar/nucleoside kinase (ribokinase family)